MRSTIWQPFSQSKPDEIYHLAAIAHVPTSYRDPRLTFEVNLYGSLNLFEVVKLISRDIKVLYVGSASEYGDVREEKIPINEDVLLRPVDPYSVSKASTDLLAYQYFKSFDMHIVRVRPFNHIGPRQSPDYVVSSFAKQIAEIEKSLKEPGEVYNICSGKAVSIQEVLDKLLKLSDKEIKIEQDVERLRPADIPLSLGDSTKFRKKTGWKPGIPFEKTLRDTLDYWSGKVDK
jgi:GDP-4-dehydro-6-deoxy-D-mannose reductase